MIFLFSADSCYWSEFVFFLDDVQVVVLVEVAGLRRLATCICRDANDGTSQVYPSKIQFNSVYP